MLSLGILENLLVLLLIVTFGTILIHMLFLMQSKPRKKEYKIILAKTIPNNITSVDLIKGFISRFRNHSKKDTIKEH